MKLTIDKTITDKVPSFNVIAYTMEVENAKTKLVDEYLVALSQEYLNKYDMTEIVNIPKLKEARDGYKKLGKDPSHTRPACEALLRRTVKGTGLYRLGDIIDLGNVLSLLTMRSVCVVDADKLVGDINIRIGKDNEPYEGINRGFINITNLPVYEDEIGPFGTPTSDTYRTMVNDKTTKIFIMIICFSQQEIEKDENLLLALYQKYAGAQSIKKIEVTYGKF